jgi:hypothetical protein
MQKQAQETTLKVFTEDIKIKTGPEFLNCLDE